MYAVVDFKSQPSLQTNKEDALSLQTQLKQDNPDGDWQVMGNVGTGTVEVIERLYALTHQLLLISKIDPFKLQMCLTDLSNTEITYSAAMLMHDARSWLDDIEEA